MEKKDLDELILFHQDGLDTYRLQMGPSAQYMEEQTIRALKAYRATLPEVKEAQHGDGNPVNHPPR